MSVSIADLSGPARVGSPRDRVDRACAQINTIGLKAQVGGELDVAVRVVGTQFAHATNLLDAISQRVATVEATLTARGVRVPPEEKQ